MKNTRSQSQWRSIIDAQQSSDLTVIDFCRVHQLATSTFYAARKKLESVTNGFVRAKVTQEIELVAEHCTIELCVGQAKVTLPSSTPACYLGQVLRELVE